MNCCLFNGLSEKEKTEISDFFGEPIKVSKDSELYKNGFVCILKKGSALIKRCSNIDNQINIKVISDGEMFGVASVFGKWQEGFSSVTAKENCEVYYLSEEMLKTIFTRFPEVSYNYIRFLSDRIRFLNRRIDTFSADNTSEKLYEYLLSLSKDGKSAYIDFSISELARRLNVGRSSLYRDMTALENAGLIIRKGKTFIINNTKDDVL